MIFCLYHWWPYSLANQRLWTVHFQRFFLHQSSASRGCRPILNVVEIVSRSYFVISLGFIGTVAELGLYLMLPYIHFLYLRYIFCNLNTELLALEIILVKVYKLDSSVSGLLNFDVNIPLKQ